MTTLELIDGLIEYCRGEIESLQKAKEQEYIKPDLFFGAYKAYLRVWNQLLEHRSKLEGVERKEDISFSGAYNTDLAVIDILEKEYEETYRQ
jgi:hypothetical protein